MFAQCSSKYVLNDVPNIMQKESLSFFCTLLNLSSLREDKLWPSTIIFLFCLNFASLFFNFPLHRYWEKVCVSI